MFRFKTSFDYKIIWHSRIVDAYIALIVSGILSLLAGGLLFYGA